MNARQRKLKGNQRKFIELVGTLSQKQNYIKRFMYLLELIEPGIYELNTTASLLAFIEDKRIQMSVAVFGANPFRYEPYHSEVRPHAGAPLNS